MSEKHQYSVNNKHYLSLFQNARDGIYRSTPEGEYLDANPALVKMLGYDSRKELMALNIPEKVYAKTSKRPGPDEREKIFTTRLQKKNGELIWAEINSWVVRDDNGNILYYEGIVRDITKRKEYLRELHNTKEQLKITLKSIGDGVIVTDIKGRVVLINKCAERLTGYTQEEASGKTLTEIFHIINEYSRKQVKNPVQKVIKTGEIEGLANHTVLLTKEGKEKAIADSAAPIKNKEGKIIGVVLVFRDVSKRRKMIKQLKFSRERYKTLFENTGTAMLIIEEDTTISMVNKGMEELTGYDRQEIEGRMSWKQFVAFEDDLKRMLKYHNARRNRETSDIPPASYEFTLVDKMGNKKYVMANISMLPDYKQSIASFIDISDRKKYEEKIRYLGYHDKLTGVYNRAFLSESLERLDTKRQLPISIIMGDVNGLKLVNNGFGHKKGDELIKQVAEIIKSCCRQEDIIARWGGDEFVVLLPQTVGKDAEKIIERIKEKCNNVEDDFVQPSIAMGYSTKTNPEEEIREVLAKAEEGVYKHKLVEGKSIRSSIISSLEETLLEKDYETREHTTRVKNLVVKMGKALALPRNKIDDLILLASLHDIGKIAVPDSILLKKGKLNKEEWAKMKKHSEIGYRIAQSCPELISISEGILHHHEWWDGTGYPYGLKAEDIPLISRIISIVDAYDVMLHERCYKKAISKKEAIVELKRCAGTQFDPELVKIFIRHVLRED